MYSLIGATGVLGGVLRSSISLVVIVVEGTGGIDFVFTIIVAIAVSNWVAAHMHHPGIYEGDLERDSNIRSFGRNITGEFKPPTDFLRTPCVLVEPYERRPADRF
eukprot:4011932-Pyramimonas_sp.AAC.1